MFDATLGTIFRLKANANSGQSPQGSGRRPETQIRNTQVQQPQRLLDGSKRDGCVVRNFADVLGVAHEATRQSHALCPTVCLRHRGKPPAVDKSSHAFVLAPSTRHDVHSCAFAQLNGGHFGNSLRFRRQLRQRGLGGSQEPQASCVNGFQTAGLTALAPTLIREGTHHETDADQRHAS